MARQHDCDCGARMLWAVTINDKAMPLDAAPNSAQGNIVLLHRPGKDPLALLLSNLSELARAAAERNDVPLYTSHFFTCPNAAQHRRSREASHA